MAASALVFVSAGPAGACVLPDLGLSGSLPPVGPTPAAGPGDTVGFTISSTEAGAEYVLTIGGRQVASGRDENGGGLSSSFTMPDLGAAQTVLVEATITHEGETWPRSKPLVFKPPTGTAKPSPPEQGGETDGAHRAQEQKAAERAKTSAPAAAATATGGATKSTRPATKPTVTRPSPAPRAESRWPLSLSDAHPVASATAVSVAASPVTTPAAPAPSKVPWYPLVLAALGLLAVGSVVAGLVLARRRRPDVPDDPIEAELQEIIAEERAKQELTRAP